ncbi:hypothetical protein Bca4012_077083 [Brassica carinata]|uniref:Uncharacterized protein n=1 Tax=Brassica oleracea TaxID=3712 RepID=A0A3P6EAU0_BRAOL|nr:unnamed protein product [Brassica oleracea]
MLNVPLSFGTFGHSYVYFMLFSSIICTSTETKKVHLRHLPTCDALQLLLTLEHAHIFSAIVTTTACSALQLITSWEFFMFCFWLTSTSAKHHFLCIFELPSVLSVGRPQETCPNCRTDVQSLKSSSRSHDALEWNVHMLLLPQMLRSSPLLVEPIWSFNLRRPSLVVYAFTKQYSLMYLTFCGSRN